MPDTSTALTDEELTTIASEISKPEDLATFMKPMTPDERTRLGHIYLQFGDHAEAKDTARLKTMGKAGVEAATIGPFEAVYQGAKAILMGHPEKIITGPIEGLKKAWEGDPAAVGSVLGGVEAPFAAKTGVRFLNKAGTSMATNPMTQSGLDTAMGSVTGALGAKQIGVSPFIGGIVGRNLFRGSGLPGKAGEFLEKVTGGREGSSTEAPSGPTANALTEAEVATLKKQGFTPAQIDELQRGSQGRSAVEISANRPTRPVTSIKFKGQTEAPAPSHPPTAIDTAPFRAGAEDFTKGLVGDISKKVYEDYPIRPEPSHKVALSSAPASRTSKPMSTESPNLSVEDMKAVREATGITNPEIRIQGITQEVLKKILEERARRAGSYKSSAELESSLKSAVERDQ